MSGSIDTPLESDGAIALAAALLAEARRHVRHGDHDQAYAIAHRTADELAQAAAPITPRTILEALDRIAKLAQEGDRLAAQPAQEPTP